MREGDGEMRGSEERGKPELRVQVCPIKELMEHARNFDNIHFSSFR